MMRGTKKSKANEEKNVGQLSFLGAIELRVLERYTHNAYGLVCRGDSNNLTSFPKLRRNPLKIDSTTLKIVTNWNTFKRPTAIPERNSVPCTKLYRGIRTV